MRSIGRATGVLRTNWIGNDRPNIRMRLQDQRDSFHGGRVRALAALSQTLFNQCFRIGQQANSLARRTFATKIIRQIFAIGRLRKHPRQRKFPHAARSGEEQRVWYALTAQRPAQSLHDARISQKFRKAHI